MKTIFPAIAFIFLSCAASAQEKENLVRAGARAGVNINKITGQKFKDGFNYNFQAGGFLQINFSERVGLQPELNFVQSTATYTDDPNDITDDVFLSGTQHKSKMNRLEVPLLVNLNVGPSKRVKVQGGPAYSALLNQTIDDIQAGKDNFYKKGEWSFIAGLWLQLPLINISARYKQGLTNISNIVTGDDWKNQSIQVGVGFTL